MTMSLAAGNAEVDRLSFAVLRDAYIDLANLVKLARPGIQHTVLRDLEQNVVAALEDLINLRSRDGHVDAVAIEVGEKLYAVLDEARAPIAVDLDPLDERLATGWKLA